MVKDENINNLRILIDNVINEVAGLHGDTEKIENELFEAITGIIGQFLAKRGDPKSINDNGIPVDYIITLYNDILGDHLPKLRVKSDKIIINIKMRWSESKERQNVIWWRDYFERVKASRFLIGSNERTWRANLEWIVNKNNMVKISNGHYDNWESAESKGRLLSSYGESTFKAAMRAKIALFGE
jgi:hypothetical protein